MSERVKPFEGVARDHFYDINAKNELYRASWLKRIWIILTFQNGARIQRIQSFADNILSNLEGEKLTSEDFEEVQKVYQTLKLKMSPELYALKAPFDPSDSLNEAIWIQKAKAWKENQECLDRRELSANDILRIKKGASFNGFDELMQDDRYQHEFFTWTLRFRLPAELFICFPGLRNRLTESWLHDQLASDEGTNLVVDPLARKVELLFESSTWKNLLDKNEHISLGNIDFTMDQVLYDFAEAQYSVQHLRYFPKLAHPDPNHKREGVCFWQKNVIDLSKERFFEDLPPVRRLTAEEVDSCFDKPLKGRWIFGIAVASDSNKETFAGNHAFLIMGIPMKDGIYSFFPFGKLPTFYPRNTPEYIKLIFEMVDSEIIYPDDNIDQFGRKHLIIPIVCDEETGMKALKRIKKDILKSHKGLKRLLFHIGALNCCQWVEKLAKKVFDQLPDLFGVNLFELQPSGFAGHLFKIIHPHKWAHPYIVNPFVYFMGGRKARIIDKEDRSKSYSVWEFGPWYKEKGFFSASILFSRGEKLKSDIRAFSHLIQNKDLQL